MASRWYHWKSIALWQTLAKLFARAWTLKIATRHAIDRIIHHQRTIKYMTMEDIILHDYKITNNVECMTAWNEKTVILAPQTNVTIYTNLWYQFTIKRLSCRTQINKIVVVKVKVIKFNIMIRLKIPADNTTRNSAN